MVGTLPLQRSKYCRSAQSDPTTIEHPWRSVSATLPHVITGLPLPGMGTSHYPYDEPEEWAGRGRDDWPTVGATRRMPPVSHRDTEERRRLRDEKERLAAATEQAEQERDRLSAAADQASAAARVRAVARVYPFDDSPPAPDRADRLLAWLAIGRETLTIIALLVLLYFGGYALVHGGWPIWLPVR
jgi:hypothetical protein